MGTILRGKAEEKTRKVAENVYWIGVHFPDTQFSVNAFLLIDETVVLVDTGAVPTGKAVLNNIQKYVDPERIDYIVATHSCVDHVGGLATLLDSVGKVKMVGHPYLEIVLGLYGYKTEFVPALEGSKMDLGKMSLWFLPPMFLDSWDTIYIFEERNRILFTADTFCNAPKRWQLFSNDDIREEIRNYHTLKFPATSLGDMNKLKQATSALKRIQPKILAPGHGLLLNKNIDSYIDTMAEIL